MEILTADDNLASIEELNRQWVLNAMGRTAEKRIVLDMDSSESPVRGEQEGSAYNGHFNIRCYDPLFCFNHHGDCEGATLRPGNVHCADGWQEALDPIVERYEQTQRKYFRGDAAFAIPVIYQYLEEHSFKYAIRLPAK